ncbi:hypothetical protein PHMEG_00013899 [Phytophthora megakarya]|uniref:Polyprotein n=1 Tax=Phytophthora megakarya TaxID=4795 RepID=A0A225W544_9STRA|nr:hypothetical protein PHMEG_00013899 [Phytophthora megakarya]
MKDGISSKRDLQLEVYCDAAFACEKERKLSKGFVVFLNGCCIAWGSKKQPIVTLSTTESEYVALAHGIKECIGLKQLIHELGFDVGNVIVHVDNQAAQHVAEGKGASQRSRHIDLRYHWVREQVQKDIVQISYRATAVMVADLFTKPLSHNKFNLFVMQLGLCRVGVSGRATLLAKCDACQYHYSLRHHV